jgi:hypothetical protein
MPKPPSSPHRLPSEPVRVIHEMRDLLSLGEHMSGLELAASLEPRLNRLVVELAPLIPLVRSKLFGLRGWLGVLRRPDALQHYGGIGYVRSFLLADCEILECYLGGPPDSEDTLP